MRYSKGGVSYGEALAMTWPELLSITAALSRIVERENEPAKE